MHFTGLLLLFNEINGSIQLKNNAYEARSHLFGYEEMLAKDDFHPTVASDTDLLANSTDEYSDESILSLLLKAFKKLTNKFYKPPALSKFFIFCDLTHSLDCFSLKVLKQHRGTSFFNLWLTRKRRRENWGSGVFHWRSIRQVS